MIILQHLTILCKALFLQWWFNIKTCYLYGLLRRTNKLSIHFHTSRKDDWQPPNLIVSPFELIFSLQNHQIYDQNCIQSHLWPETIQHEVQQNGWLHFFTTLCYPAESKLYRVIIHMIHYRTHLQMMDWDRFDHFGLSQSL